MQSDIRWKQRFANFSKAYKQLSDAVELMQERQLTDLEKQGTIQAFEYSYELGCNVLKDYLTWQGETGLSGSRDTIREAFQVQLIEDGDGWMDMLQDRNRTSHTYNEETAAAILTNIRSRYLGLFSALHNKMEKLKAGSD